MNHSTTPVTTSLEALEREEPSGVFRSVLYVLLTMLFLLLLWAIFGHLDIVAVAQGKLVPTTYVKIVQPADSGVVKEILIAEGQRVKAGQVLMRMDSSFGEADWKALLSDYHIKDLTIRRIDAELSGLPLHGQPGDPETALLQALAQYAADKQALASALAEARSVEDSARQELAAAEQVRAKLAQTLPHYQSEEKSYRELAEQGYVGRLMANEKSRDRIEREQDLYAQEATLQAIRAKIRQAQEKIRQLDADHRAKLHAERLEAVAQFEKLRQELSKQSRRNALLELKAPQDGIIKDLATHTAGTVVSPGTILMTLVPDAERLRAEVWIQNDDIGFVRPDMPVKLKLSAYPFQKYGMLSGKVIHVGADAADENKNNAQDSSHDVVTGHLLYRTLVQLDTPYLIADGHRHRLTPGMQVVAEVRLGERSVLEYVLSPVQKALQEAARER